MSPIDIFLRIFLSIFLGSIIGYERQSMHKYAGTRTYSLVCLGSCVTSIISILLFNEYSSVSNLDPARLSSQVLSGIGFLGAGAIMKNKGAISGLTTAAGLWGVSIAGIAIGYGYYYLTAVIGVSLFIILYAMRVLEFNYKSLQTYKLHIIVSSNDFIPYIYEYLTSSGIHIDFFDVEKNINDTNDLYDIVAAISSNKKIDISKICNDILNSNFNISSISYK